MVDLQTGLTAAATAVTILKSLAGLSAEVGNAKAEGELSKLRDSVMEMQNALSGAILEKLELARRIADLETETRTDKAKLAQREELEHDGFVYWRKDGADKTPFCPFCYEKDGKLIHLTPYLEYGKAYGEYICKAEGHGYFHSRDFDPQQKSARVEERKAASAPRPSGGRKGFMG